MRLTLLALLIILVADTTHADENLAAKIGFPKDFDPVAAVPKAERLDQDKRVPLKVVKAKGGKLVPAKPRGVAAAGGTSVDQQRQARMMRARQRKAAIVAGYARQDAMNAAADAANIGWGLRFVGHY